MKAARAAFRSVAPPGAVLATNRGLPEPPFEGPGNRRPGKPPIWEFLSGFGQGEGDHLVAFQRRPHDPAARGGHHHELAAIGAHIGRGRGLGRGREAGGSERLARGGVEGPEPPVGGRPDKVSPLAVRMVPPRPGRPVSCNAAGKLSVTPRLRRQAMSPVSTSTATLRCQCAWSASSPMGRFPAQAMPRSMTLRILGLSRLSTIWPCIQTKALAGCPPGSVCS